MKNDFRILVVEDNRLNQKILSFWLSKDNYQFEVSETGEDAIDAFSKRWFDLIIMDIMLPGINGFETTSRLREMENVLYGRKTYILALTANTMDNDRDNCIKVGMNEYMSKPFDMKKLKSIIESVYLQKF